MSKIKLKSDPSGTATFTIESPATNTDRTLVLPDAAGTVIVGTQPAGDIVGTTATQTLTNKTLTSPTLTTPNINSAQVATVSGTAPIFMCRAWCNFNGTGTVAIRASGNVSSITDNGTGDYTVNFTTAMPDNNYCVSGTGARSSTATGSNQDIASLNIRNTGSMTTTSVRVLPSTSNTSGSTNAVRATDFDTVVVAIHR